MSKLLDHIKDRFSQSIIRTHDELGDDTVVIRREDFKSLIKYLKKTPDWNMNVLLDLTAVDYFSQEHEQEEKKEYRYEVVYHLYSTNYLRRLRIKVPLPNENPEIETLSGLWPIADWLEREVWDMFGIKFLNHPHLTRLLMYEEFEGHPLRKDYPYYKRQPLIGP